MDYFIPKNHKGGIQLEILNAKNDVVSTILSDSTQLKSTLKEVEDMQLSQILRYVDNKLNEKPGLNRFEWDLSQKGPWHKDKKRSYKNGPMVAPGIYTARLTVGEQSIEQRFEIVMDPRVEAEGLTKTDIEIQIEMLNKVSDLLSDARRLQDDLEKEAKSLKDKKAKDKVERLEKVNAVLSQLKNDDGAYPKQMLVSQISYLLNILEGADKLPGQEEKDRYQELFLQLSEVKESAKD